MGHSWARTIQDHHFQLLPRRSRHHRCLRLHRSWVFQQSETVARGNRPLRMWKRQQTVSGEQVRPYVKKGCRPANSQGMSYVLTCVSRTVYRVSMKSLSILCQEFRGLHKYVLSPLTHPYENPVVCQVRPKWSQIWRFVCFLVRQVVLYVSVPNFSFCFLFFLLKYKTFYFWYIVSISLRNCLKIQNNYKG